MGSFAGGARIKRWWYVQGNVAAPGSRGGRTAPYRVAVDLEGVPRNYLARLVAAETDGGSPEDWCRRELPAICDWLVHACQQGLARGGEVEPEVRPLDDGMSVSAAPDERASLGHTALLPGAEFYLLNHPSHSRSRWDGSCDRFETSLRVSR